MGRYIKLTRDIVSLYETLRQGSIYRVLNGPSGDGMVEIPVRHGTTLVGRIEYEFCADNSQSSSDIEMEYIDW